MQATRMFRILVQRGFLRMVRPSSFDGKSKQARTWRLMTEPDGDEPATKESMRWQPSENRESKSAPANTRVSVSNTHVKTKGDSGQISTTHVIETAADGQNQYHPRYTYNIPGGAAEPTPLPRTWKPQTATSRTAVERFSTAPFRVRWRDIHKLSKLFTNTPSFAPRSPRIGMQSGCGCAIAARQNLNRHQHRRCTMTDQAADRQFELSIMSYATGVSRPKIRSDTSGS
jgi:hypothetical protein